MVKEFYITIQGRRGRGTIKQKGKLRNTWREEGGVGWKGSEGG